MAEKNSGDDRTRHVVVGWMKPIVNLEETPGKVVGRVRPVDYDRLVEMAESIVPRRSFPKRSLSFSRRREANAWKDQNILQAALKKARARQPGS